MRPSNLHGSRRSVRRPSAIVDACAPVACEPLETRQHLSTYNWTVPSTDPWTSTAPTSVTLKGGTTPGTVRAFLNGNPGITPDHTFSNTTGMDVIDSGSISSFLFVDQIPAADKPTSDGTNDGIKVQGGSNCTLKIDETNNTSDTLIQVTDSTTVTTNDGFNIGASRMGSGVSNLSIIANNAGSGEIDVLTYPYFGTISSVRIDTGTATHDTINIGGAENTSVTGAVVLTGAGNDTVNLNQDDDADGTTAVTVDFGAGTGSGNGLGLGNALNIGTNGSGTNCTATLAQASGTSGHTVVVDHVQVSNGGTFVVADTSTVGDITVDSASSAEVQAPLTVAPSGSTSGTFDVDGTATFTGDSAPSTINNFDTSDGTVNVDADADVTIQDMSSINTLNVIGTNASVLFQYTGDYGSDSHVSNMTVTDGGLVTLQARATSPASDSGTARVLSVGTLDVKGSSSTPTGKVDVKDNDLILTSTSYSTTRTDILSGYNAGGTHWAGNGIISSVTVTSPHPTAVGYAQASDFSYSSFGGVSVSGSDILVKYTYAGDANIDGQVDVTDNGILATNWQATGKDWREADFNYDGNVDVTDLGFLATNWQAGVGSPLSPEGGGGSDPQQEFLDGIADLGLSKRQIDHLLAILNTDSLPAL